MSYQREQREWPGAVVGSRASRRGDRGIRYVLRKRLYLVKRCATIKKSATLVEN